MKIQNHTFSRIVIKKIFIVKLVFKLLPAKLHYILQYNITRMSTNEMKNMISIVEPTMTFNVTTP